MADNNPTSKQAKKVKAEPSGNRVLVLTPDQLREIDETIRELQEASRRIDELLRSR
jgi:hypothetical protein